MKEFDLVIIGGGPAGYVGAIKAAQLGMNVACIEKRANLGGTCLNVGCIPSKALLQSSELFEEAGHGFAKHGIKISQLELDLKAMMARKNIVIEDLARGIDGLFKKNKITRFEGHGEIISATQVKVGKEVIAAKNILIATGSDVISIPGVEIDEKRIVSSTGALALSEVPKSMIVIGGGYIGLEMGSVWRRLGAEVTVVEYLDQIVPAMDLEIGKQFQRILEKQGMKFMLSTKVNGAKIKGKKVELDTSNGKLEADIVLVAVGRKPYSENLGLEKVGVTKNERGQIVTDKYFRTSISNIYAVGDVIAGPMLAHKAEEEAIAAVEIMMGQKPHVNYDAIPGVVYTHPEVATVGKTEEEVKVLGIEYKIGKFPFMANSRAKANSDTDGLVKVITNAKTDEVLGIHIMGPNAGTMIGEAVIAMEYKASAEDIARTCHAHPTHNEALKEAAMAAYFKAIHI